MEEIERLSKVLKLGYIKDNYDFLINEALDQNYSYKEFLELVLASEEQKRNENGIVKRIRLAKFPFTSDLSDLDFNYYSLEIANRLRELGSLRFIDYGRNVILIGNPGVGKTTNAIALGIKACQEGKTVLYITVPNLITELKENMSLNQLSNYKKKFMKYDLIILDELGYISFDKQGSELLFNLLSTRNINKSIVITSNLPFNQWQTIFNGEVLTAAMVDRLAHKADVININAESYRLKETKEWLAKA